MKAITSWMIGKKTYLAAAALVLLGIIAWWNGAGSELSLAVIVFGLGLAGLGAKSERFGRATLAALEQLKPALADRKLTRAEFIQVALAAMNAAGVSPAISGSLALELADQFVAVPAGEVKE